MFYLNVIHVVYIYVVSMISLLSFHAMLLEYSHKCLVLSAKFVNSGVSLSYNLSTKMSCQVFGTMAMEGETILSSD